MNVNNYYLWSVYTPDFKLRLCTNLDQITADSFLLWFQKWSRPVCKRSLKSFVQW